MDEAVEDGVGEGGVADDLAPLLDRNLTGDDRRRALMTVFEDLEDVALFRLGEDGKAPVVQDQGEAQTRRELQRRDPAADEGVNGRQPRRHTGAGLDPR